MKYSHNNKAGASRRYYIIYYGKRRRISNVLYDKGSRKKPGYSKLLATKLNQLRKEPKIKLLRENRIKGRAKKLSKGKRGRYMLYVHYYGLIYTNGVPYLQYSRTLKPVWSNKKPDLEKLNQRIDNFENRKKSDIEKHISITVYDRKTDKLIFDRKGVLNIGE